MKKAISLLLILCLAFGCFAVCAAAADAPLRLLVTSDTHWQNVGSVSPGDHFFRPRDSLGQMTAITPQIINRFLADAAASDAEYIFISGDLTNTGAQSDARAFAAILAQFEDETGKQVFVIDGNHDVAFGDDMPDYKTSPATFREIYSRFGYDEALAVDEATASYTADLKNGYRLLAIDSNKPDGSGTVSAPLLAWIETQVASAQRDGKKLIAMMHHQLMEHYNLQQRIDDFYVIDNYKDVCKKFDEWNIRLTFTGHLHMSDVAVYGGKNKVYDVSSPALSCYPLTYRDVTITDSSIEIQSRTIDSLDVSDIVPGYSDAQRDMIANDPVRYAYGCMQDSFIEEYVRGYVDAENLISMLDLEPDSFPAKLIRGILPDVLIPLYGEGDTVEAKAKALGYTLTESDYETVEDLITAFWAALTGGEENLGGNSTEGNLFLESVYALFASKLGSENKALQLLLSSRIIAWLGLKGIDNVFTRAVLDRLLVGFFVDKAPADNNVTLPGYGQDAENGIWQKFADFFQNVSAFFRGLLPAI